ncbi:MAG: intradiol ring-cleavage dioxygenase [Myxococcota bacterium]
MACNRREALRILARASVFTAAPSAAPIMAGCESPCSSVAPAAEGSCAPTQDDVEGPFYVRDAPAKQEGLVEPDDDAPRLVLHGMLLDAADCTIGLGGYVLDLWHADARGRYDNEGFRYRGRVVADDEGVYTFETIMPGSYPDRPVRHIHVKILRPNGSPVITTQIYFTGDPNLSCEHVGPRVQPQDGTAELDFIVPA